RERVIVSERSDAEPAQAGEAVLPPDGQPAEDERQEAPEPLAPAGRPDETAPAAGDGAAGGTAAEDAAAEDGAAGDGAAEDGAARDAAAEDGEDENAAPDPAVEFSRQLRMLPGDWYLVQSY